MRLVRLIYTSKLNDGVNPRELANIHETALRNNDKAGLTGMLLFGNDYFLQVLEGGNFAVNRLYNRICNDDRNKDPLLLEYVEIAERDFAKWSMKLILLTEQKKSFLRTYSVGEDFDATKLSGQNAYRLLLALRE
jgi:hypothetical protein